VSQGFLKLKQSLKRREGRRGGRLGDKEEEIVREGKEKAMSARESEIF